VFEKGVVPAIVEKPKAKKHRGYGQTEKRRCGHHVHHVKVDPSTPAFKRRSWRIIRCTFYALERWFPRRQKKRAELSFGASRLGESLTERP
jgi:hypothetical protein